VTLPDGTVEVPVDLGTGAGSRGGASLGLHAGVEVADSTGGSPTVVADSGVLPSGGQTKHLALKVPAGRLVAGREYRVRYVAGNGRGLAATGPWRSFVAGGNGPSTAPGGHAPTTRLTCPAGDPQPRRGTTRADRMKGTHCRDVLLGLGGDDSLSGLAGADTLRGGRGRDMLRGGRGSDTLYGGPGGDRIYARDGRRDVVRCGSGRDSVRADRFDRLVGCERKLR
jgi:Ca2+-binding RTX toxin-like protein